MQSLPKLFIAGFFTAALVVPLVSVAAVGIPFGGKVVNVIPCLDGGFFETVVGPKGGNFIWGLGTLTFLHYQIRPGVNQVGIADAPRGCTISYYPLIVLTAPRIQMVGTSLAI